MKKVAIVQPNYIPWKGYFDIIQQVDTFVIFDEVQYTQKDWRNRNQIKTAQGLLWLTIPVKLTQRDTKIFEVYADGNAWQAKHWKSIWLNYKKAKFFDHYAPFFEQIYQRDFSEHNIAQIDYEFIKLINQLLGIKTNLIFSTQIPQTTTDRLARIQEILSYTEAKIFVNGPKARSFMVDDAFQNIGVEILWKTYDNYPIYEQLFGDFVHSVSVIDVLFNTGENALHHIQVLQK